MTHRSAGVRLRLAIGGNLKNSFSGAIHPKRVEAHEGTLEEFFRLWMYSALHA